MVYARGATRVATRGPFRPWAGYNGGVTTTHDPARPLLTVSEVADRLRVSVKTVRRRIESGELPAVRIGTGIRAPVRVDGDALDALLHPARTEAGDR